MPRRLLAAIPGRIGRLRQTCASGERRRPEKPTRREVAECQRYAEWGVSAVSKEVERPEASLPRPSAGRRSIVRARNRCRRPFAGVASTVQVGYAVPEGVHPGKIGKKWKGLSLSALYITGGLGRSKGKRGMTDRPLRAAVEYLRRVPARPRRRVRPMPSCSGAGLRSGTAQHSNR